jgi:hypothetical protein
MSSVTNLGSTGLVVLRPSDSRSLNLTVQRCHFCVLSGKRRVPQSQMLPAQLHTRLHNVLDRHSTHDSIFPMLTTALTPTRAAKGRTPPRPMYRTRRT